MLLLLYWTAVESIDSKLDTIWLDQCILGKKFQVSAS